MTCTNSFISKVKGDTYARSLVFKDKVWTAINLTGSLIKFSVKNKPSDTSYILQETLTITDAVWWKASLSAAMNMDVGSYVYDFEWTQSTGIKTTLELWKLTIINWVT